MDKEVTRRSNKTTTANAQAQVSTVQHGALQQLLYNKILYSDDSWEMCADDY